MNSRADSAGRIGGGQVRGLATEVPQAGAWDRSPPEAGTLL